MCLESDILKSKDESILITECVCHKYIIHILLYNHIDANICFLHIYSSILLETYTRYFYQDMSVAKTDRMQCKHLTVVTDYSMKRVQPFLDTCVYQLVSSERVCANSGEAMPVS